MSTPYGFEGPTQTKLVDVDFCVTYRFEKSRFEKLLVSHRLDLHIGLGPGPINS